ncbi:MAG: hypothetical protein ACM359_16740 [Bacillota bacterium]
MNDRLLKIRIWTKAILLLLLGILLMTLLLLNMNAVIEPRLHLLFTQYDRPNLLLVLLVTSFLSLIAGLLIRTIVTTVRELREVRIRSRTAGLEREIADLKRTAPPETKPRTAP